MLIVLKNRKSSVTYSEGGIITNAIYPNFH